MSLDLWIVVLRVIVFVPLAAYAASLRRWAVVPACAGFIAVSLLSQQHHRDFSLIQAAANVPLFGWALYDLLHRR